MVVVVERGRFVRHREPGRGRRRREPGADGRFRFAFTPEADARASRDLTWTYAVEADVTDEGGETRSATRQFRLGFVSVEARVTDRPGFALEGRETVLSLSRTDLDGKPRAGAGAWTLVSLQQPAKTLLPAEQPLPADADGAPRRHRTAGDEQRSRADPQYEPRQVLRLWPEGPVIARGALAHDAKGEGILTLPALPAGAYRLHYETKDAAGALYTMTQDLVAVQRRETPLALPGSSPSSATPSPRRDGPLLVHSSVPASP